MKKLDEKSIKIENDTLKKNSFSKQSADASSSSLSTSSANVSPLISDTQVIRDPVLMNLISSDDVRNIRLLLITGEKNFDELRKFSGIKEESLKSLLFTLISKGIIKFHEKKISNTSSSDTFYSITAKHFIYQQKEEIIFNDLEIVGQLNHKKKLILLNLIQSESKTIMDLSRKTDMNPGTVKRHLSDLIEAQLVTIAKEEFNNRRILLKYYITVAKKMIFHYEWPNMD
ncbi:MAG: ArsR family transcriptional regulator [Candidatus Lokiarchaeota archaeon]|nr:ArsR family transcriptional regulator [Candidatus Harpocratesius repetitus]